MNQQDFKIDYTKFGFLPYQVAWLQDDSQIKIYEKSRRIGMTYAQALIGRAHV